MTTRTQSFVIQPRPGCNALTSPRFGFLSFARTVWGFLEKGELKMIARHLNTPMDAWQLKLRLGYNRRKEW